MFKQFKVTKLTVVLIIISVFCCFVLRNGDLFKAPGVPQNATGKTPISQSGRSRSTFISSNHCEIDFFLSELPGEDNQIPEPQSLKKSLFPAITKSLPANSFYSRLRSFQDFPNHFLPAYLAYHNFRI